MSHPNFCQALFCLKVKKTSPKIVFYCLNPQLHTHPLPLLGWRVWDLVCTHAHAHTRTHTHAILPAFLSTRLKNQDGSYNSNRKLNIFYTENSMVNLVSCFLYDLHHGSFLTELYTLYCILSLTVPDFTISVWGSSCNFLFFVLLLLLCLFLTYRPCQ